MAPTNSAARNLRRRIQGEMNRAAARAREDQRSLRQFEKRLKATWRYPLQVFEACQDLSLRLGSGFNRTYRRVAAKRNDLRFEALCRLHARACSVAAEVHALLVAGHAGGAHARWRTLHEIAVVSRIILAENDEIALRFLAHEAIDRAKDARLHLKYQARIGLERITAEDIAPNLAEEKALLARFGSQFGERYGWAAPLFSKSYVSFFDLEVRATLDHWRPYYSMSSSAVHSGSHGASWNLGAGHLQHFLLAGASNNGLTDPAHQTLISLLIVTMSFLELAPETNRRSLQQMVLSGLVDHAGDAFLVVQRELDSKQQSIRTG